MTIYTNSFTITGAAYNSPIYTNILGMNGYSNMTIDSDLHVGGNVFSSGRFDVSTTVAAIFRLTSNVSFETSNVYSDTTNTFSLDFLSSDIGEMSNLPMVIPSSNIYDPNTGIITIPMNGLYNLEMQGSFSNSTQAQTQNGVWYKLIDATYPDVRVSANISQGALLAANHMAFLQGGQRVLPEFYSSDSNATLVADNNETYVSFTLVTSYRTQA